MCFDMTDTWAPSQSTFKVPIEMSLPHYELGVLHLSEILTVIANQLPIKKYCQHCLHKPLMLEVKRSNIGVLELSLIIFLFIGISLLLLMSYTGISASLLEF